MNCACSTSKRPADGSRSSALAACKAPAKVNLFLRVTGRRPDGYHLLQTLMCPVDWYDHLELELCGQGIRVACNHPQVPGQRHNLAWKAADVFRRSLAGHTGQELEGISIRLEKNIPVGAGLGGGSSDAAAVLKMLNQLCRHPFSKSRLQSMALTLGADVPFFLEDGPCLASGVGERLLPVGGLQPKPLVILYPQVVVSTAEVFKNLNLGLTKIPERLKYHHFDGLEILDFCRLGNDLEKVTLVRYPEVAAARKALMHCGAEAAGMSGSGSAVFGFFPSGAAACKAGRILGRETGWQVFVGKLLVDHPVGS